MSAPTYRPGDIAMVKEFPEIDAVPGMFAGEDRYETAYWILTTGRGVTEPHEVGPVLGNVGDIAATALHLDAMRKDTP